MGLQRVTTEQIEKAVEKQKEEQAQKGQSSGFQRNFENLHFTALDINKLKFVRIYGVPLQYRENHDPYYSPKLINISWILDDKGKMMRVVWPSKDENLHWPLFQIKDKLLSYEFSRSSESPQYYYQYSKPKLFYRVYKNKILSSSDILPNGKVTDNFEKSLNPYEKGWKYTQYIVMNVIDRAMMDWHKENEHTVLLSKKARTKTDSTGQSSTIYEPGVPRTVYDILNNEIMPVYHDFLDYDIIIKKLDSQPWYKLWHPQQENMFIALNARNKEEFLKEYPFYDPEMHLRPLTDEEQSWERYNLDQIYKVTSYQKIRNRLGSFIKEFDREFNTKIYDEVSELAKREKERYSNDDEDDDDDGDRNNSSSSSIVKEKEIKQNTSNPLPVRKERKPSAKSGDKVAFELEPFKESGFVGIDKLTDEEKVMITGYDEEKGTFIYHTDEDIYKCVNSQNKDNPCSMEAPGSFAHCPKCGIEF